MTLRTLLVLAALPSVLASGPALAVEEVAGGEASGSLISLQGSLPATFRGPRRLAATPAGRLLVIDADARLHLLTARGGVLAPLADGVRAVTAGAGKVFAVTQGAELLAIDEGYGRVERRVSLGVGDAPVGISWDAARGVIWMAFRSGMVQARRPDGSVALQVDPAVAGPLVRLVDVAVDARAGVVWVAQDRSESGGMIFALSAVDGARIRAVGADGTGPARIPGALAVAAGGQLHVADLFGGQVAVVNGDGAPLAPVGAGALKQPSGLAFMANGDLLVANMGAGRIDRFGLGLPLPSCAGDADCDGIPDDVELANGLDPNDAGDALRDADGDGLLNAEELALGTSLRSADTDGDGFADGDELASGYDPLDAKDHLPVVTAGSAGEHAPGRVTLSASVSNVSDVSACKATWTQTGGAAVKLSGADGFSPGFVARKAGAYEFSVRATCAGLTSDPVKAAATVRNLAPIVDAPRVVTVEVGGGATLSAGRSSDANGDALTFHWSQTSGPPASDDRRDAAISPRFTAPGAHRFTVTAADGAGAASEAEVIVLALGKKPVAAPSVVGPVLASVGEVVSLDASGSYREAGAAFAWSQVSGPAVALTGAGAPVASFTAPAAGRYAFEVVITQAGIASPPGRVEVFVAEAGRSLPVAVAAAEAVAPVGAAVLLDGSRSTAGAGGGLEYAWRQLSGPAAGLGAASSPVASAHLFEPGAYEFELTVREGEAVGVPVRVRLEARKDGKAIPVARVKAPASVRLGREVVLDGTGSTGARQYRWTQLGGPWVELGGAARETFKARAAGTYVFELEVDDGQVRSAPARVSVVVADDGEN